MRKLALAVLAVSCLGAHAHVACESSASSEEFVAKNIEGLIRLGEQTSPALSQQGRMLLAVSALKSGLNIEDYNRAETEVPNTIAGNPRALLDGEERAVIAVASVEYKTSVREIMDRAALTSGELFPRGNASCSRSLPCAAAGPIEWLDEAAQAVRANP